MSFKQVMFYLGCGVTWFVLLPVFVVGGGIALFVYAVFSELSDFFLGESRTSVDRLTAREIARRVCLGH